MLILCLVCLAGSVLLFVPSPRRAGRAVGFAAMHEPRVNAHLRMRRRWVTVLGWVGGGFGAVLVAHRLGGAPAAVVAGALLIMVAACVRLVRQASSARVAARARREVAHACNVLASQIRVGRVPAEALRTAAEDCPVLATASIIQDLGGDVAGAWRHRSRQPGHAGLADLARAWQVSTRTGAPLAQNLEQVAEALSADQALRMVVAGELAATRATGKIMAALPFCGLGMGYLIGGDPLRFLLDNPYGWACMVLGVSLAVAGVLWIDWLARRAAEQV